MHARLGLVLVYYGTFLLLCGVGGYVLTGETSTSSLLNGGVFGSMMAVVGILLRQGRMWTYPAALSATAIFSLTFAWRIAIQVIEALAGVPGRWPVVGLLGAMLAASIVVLRLLYAQYRH